MSGFNADFGLISNNPNSITRGTDVVRKPHEATAQDTHTQALFLRLDGGAFLAAKLTIQMGPSANGFNSTNKME